VSFGPDGTGACPRRLVPHHVANPTFPNHHLSPIHTLPSVTASRSRSHRRPSGRAPPGRRKTPHQANRRIAASCTPVRNFYKQLTPSNDAAFDQTFGEYEEIKPALG
jgi:hypothetical protein